MTTEDDRVAFITEAPEKHPDAAKGWLAAALRDNAQSVRYAAAETIGAYNIPLVKELELSLAEDPNYMVRLACAESLGMLRQEGSEKALMQALSDRHYLVRGWAADSLSWYQQPEVNESLHSYIAWERMHFGQANALAALIKQGDQSLLPRLMTFLNDRNYRTRITLVHLLTDVATPETATDVKAALEKRQSKEEVISVRSAIATALSERL